MVALLINLLIILLVAGLILYTVRLLIPALGLPGVLVNIISAVVVVFVVIWLLYALPIPALHQLR